MAAEVESRANEEISIVRLNRRYRAVIHKELTIYRSDVPSEICLGKIEIERKRDGEVVGSLLVDLTGISEVTNMDRENWRSRGKKFLQERTKQKPR